MQLSFYCIQSVKVGTCSLQLCVNVLSRCLRNSKQCPGSRKATETNTNREIMPETHRDTSTMPIASPRSMRPPC